ncbi:MAG TPA: ATP synthase F0 subunit B [Candidatus Omnitrophica bacterium]|nr:MAG: ATP synthase F0 subunit B [Omnitrophica WOR_2 bacterium GWA2_63_20]OGX17626.1 MAG: ATP synthase F0 subunit B [Omnitrophica WOR_2 bacterium GWF2_63_9]OGX36479.1 MAG: ATP synthase F0 subunit B [Omnitrophica WOR_2 bacterium RIFCSPHIGHO2_02_FULL_63_39]OGX44818.1 MAG: ATP synthase F0 subunit B [Omnitrophica WOR_2 bacterium RIFCSPLOWO2_02_FULL_63_16]OGX48049.1 MAG: ATP synthase F0 subunit B [Omnitrophica WOR_2 bacterium RIFCSPLOWO2_12_FULL_63_16]HAM41567.1 ATP synthase F0 subunit B [Candidat
MLTQIATTVLGFFLLVVFLKKFFWSTILRMLDERRHTIEGQFRRIEETQAKLAGAQEELTRRLVAIDEESRAKIQQAVLEGKRIAGEIQEEARAQAQAVIAKSKETIEVELAKAKVSLRDDLADLTVEAAARLLGERCDADADRRLVRSIIDELERPPPSTR